VSKVQTIVRKEWAEVFKNRLVLFTVAFLPLFLTTVPLIMLAVTRSLGEAFNQLNNSGEVLEIFGSQCVGLSEFECGQYYTLSIFTLMFMILPVAIPVTIAAYSIVGEKTTHTLEPLLATPITTTELLAGKALAAIIPAILATWGSYALYLLGVRLLASETIFGRVLDPIWLLAIIVLGPLLALMAVCFAIIISSRVSDPRVAEQLSALIVLPLILLIVGQSVGLILINRAVVMILIVLVGLLDILLVAVSVRLFQRETILTRWR
jgi:ABC-2 type transport system permease protein